MKKRNKFLFPIYLLVLLMLTMNVSYGWRVFYHVWMDTNNVGDATLAVTPSGGFGYTIKYHSNKSANGYHEVDHVTDRGDASHVDIYPYDNDKWTCQAMEQPIDAHGCAKVYIRYFRENGNLMMHFRVKYFSPKSKKPIYKIDQICQKGVIPPR